jgi:hypothetical protein
MLFPGAQSSDQHAASNDFKFYRGSETNGEPKKDHNITTNKSTNLFKPRPKQCAGKNIRNANHDQQC